MVLFFQVHQFVDEDVVDDGGWKQVEVEGAVGAAGAPAVAEVADAQVADDDGDAVGVVGEALAQPAQAGVAVPADEVLAPLALGIAPQLEPAEGGSTTMWGAL